jgi:hypothetical protein
LIKFAKIASANHSIRNNFVLDSAPATAAAFEVEMAVGDDEVGSEGKREMGRSVLPGTSSTPPPLLRLLGRWDTPRM